MGNLHIGKGLSVFGFHNFNSSGIMNQGYISNGRQFISIKVLKLAK